MLDPKCKRFLAELTDVEAEKPCKEDCDQFKNCNEANVTKHIDDIKLHKQFIV